ncbi:MAG: hypothetical protein H6Q72_1896 [Firmicutes bacterium]|nr:hypothetical protein [Bacillota bacterium]
MRQISIAGVGKMNKNIFYIREKELTIQYGGTTSKFILIGLSAKDKEHMLLEAQKNHTIAVQRLSEAAQTIKSVYLMQDAESLSEAIVNTEREKYVAKAMLTMAEGETSDRETVEKKAQIIMQAAQEKLRSYSVEQLTEKLVGWEMERQFHNAWTCAVLEATLLLLLHDENRQRLFNSVEEMKIAIPCEVLDELYEATAEWLTECSEPQVFLKPHTSKS